MNQSHALYFLHVPTFQQDSFEEAVTDGYISYCQALELGLKPTPDYLYTFILNKIRDVRHTDRHNTAYIFGWLAAHYENERSYGSIQHHLLLSSFHLTVAQQYVERLNNDHKERQSRS